MPLVASTPLDLKSLTISTGPVTLVSPDVMASVSASLTGGLTESTIFQQIDTSIETDGYLLQFEEEFSVSTPLNLYETDIETFGVLIDELEQIIARTPLQLQVGTVAPKVNPLRATTPLSQIQAYHILFQRVPVFLLESLLYGSGPLITVSGQAVILEEGELELVDLLGPQIFNEIPTSGSTFNNPNTEISFDLIDTGGANIVLSGTQIYINGTLVINAGANVTPSGFGTTIFTPISSSFYQFQFTPANPFSPDIPVTVSGRSSDNVVPENVEYFLYQFGVWKTQDLGASITGLADTLSPFLENLSPDIFEMEVPIDTNILLTVNDLHTGVDLSSIVLSVGNETVFSGAEDVSLLYDVSQSGTTDGRGYNFTINPVSNFGYDQEVEISVFATDKFGPVNTLDTSYSFFTVSNAHLVASGLQIFQDISYEDMDISASYVTASSTMFHITYLNLEGSGVSISGSSVLLNGIEIPSTITPVSGNPLAYDVYFELEPDYRDDADLTFHVQQSGTVSGSVLFKDYETELLWGYEFCYDKDRLPHDTVMNYFVQASDYGEKPQTSYFVKSFTTKPLDSNVLYAQIYPIDPEFHDLNATLISNNPFFEYGKTMYLELDVEDFAGNKRTFAWNFTIEDEPN